MSAPRSLEDLVPPDVFIGASLIIREGERFLYGVRPPEGHVLELTGIGGGLEPDDESSSACARREALEEIASDVTLHVSAETLVVRGPDDIERVALEGIERPAAIVFRNHRTPPRQPWHPEHSGRACLVVFTAELCGTPRPAMELPQLVWLKPEHVLRTSRADVPFGDLLETGAGLVEGSSEVPDLPARLTDSHEALAVALGDEILPLLGA